MPLIQVTAVEGSVSDPNRQTLMSRISDAVLEAENASPDFEGAQALVWAYFNERPANSVFVGGNNIDQPPLVIEVTAPEGAIPLSNKEKMVSVIGTIVDDAVGQYEGRLNHWIILRELTEGNWSGSGQIFPLATIQTAMNIKAA